MRALILDEKAKKEIQRVKSYAEKNRYTSARMQSLLKKEELPCGDNPNHVGKIDMGFRFVYSVEEHPCGWCHHLSVSVDDPLKAPNRQSVELIRQEFGMNAPWNECYAYLEENRIVNVIELYGNVEYE